MLLDISSRLSNIILLATVEVPARLGDSAKRSIKHPNNLKFCLALSAIPRDLSCSGKIFSKNCSSDKKRHHNILETASNTSNPEPQRTIPRKRPTSDTVDS